MYTYIFSGKAWDRPSSEPLRSCIALLVGMSSSHSWEAPHRVHSWGRRAPEDYNAGGDSDESDIEEDLDTPGHKLVEMLLSLTLLGTLSCQQCCVLMFWAFKAGISEAKPYSLKPGSPSGHYARKIRTSLGHVGSRELYDVGVPGHAKHDIERTVHIVPTLPPHEQLVEDVEQSSGLFLRCREWIQSGKAPPIYTNHIVTRDAAAKGESPPIPIGLFIDAVPYSLTDSVIGPG